MIQPKKSVTMLEAYSPPTSGREGMLRLDFNENTVGCSLKVIEALKRIDSSKLSVYPEYGELLQKLSKRNNILEDELVLTNGTDEAINMVMNCFVKEGDEVIIPTPTFAMFKFYATLAGASVKEVLYKKDFSFPFEEVINSISTKTKIIVLVNPNNPTGTLIPEEQIKQIINKAQENNALVMIDEAYYEFYRKTFIGFIKKYDNLFVTRTFSKAFGLAGVRIGYIMGNREIIEPIKKAISPYSVNTVALICAKAALTDEAFVENYSNEIIKNREILAKQLKELGIKTFPSFANFVLGDFGKNCETVYTKLKEKGILVRNRTKDPLLKGCIRIGVGTAEQNEIFISALKEIIYPKALIFDIDGVLVDVSNSYRTAIAKTVEYFTKNEVQPLEISQLKQKTGFNNDWDLSEALIKKRGFSVPKEKIIEKFQELYLGKNGVGGLIENEKWLIRKGILEELAKKYALGILTGRPKEEAFIALDNACAKKYFKVIIAMEDCEGKGKPNPFGLNLALEKLRVLDKTGSVYVGDVPDDMRAAKNAGLIGVGSLPPQDKSNELKEILLNAGAKSVIFEVNEIIKVVK
jgi:histidinol-phosphate aminotransferase